jgi:hypothetical protein
MSGLGDESKALYYEYGPSMHIELLLSLANDLGASELCRSFSNYLEHYSRMQKYRIAQT